MWLCVCFLLWVIYILLDAFTIYRFLHTQGYRTPYRSVIYISLIGLYYCNITPGASGGQPLQVYYLNKRSVPIGISSSALTVKFFCFQVMLIFIGTLAWLMHKEYVYSAISENMWILVLGYLFNGISVLFVVLLSISRRAVRLFIVLFIKVGTKLHMCKDPDAATARWEGNLATFHKAIVMLTKKPWELALQLLIAAVQVITWMLIPAAIYYSFGLSGAGLLQLVTISLLLYISAAYTPLPGASGAQEGGFAIYFAGVFPHNTLFVALLVWRFFTFYLTLIVGSVTTIFPQLTKKRARRETGQ
jgi:uncharacterized protein (TIRG00374 family)